MNNFGLITRYGKKIGGGNILLGESASYEYNGKKYIITPAKDGYEYPYVEEIKSNKGESEDEFATV